MAYATLELGAKPTAGLTNAYIPLEVKDIDLFNWLVDTGGTFTNKLRGTLTRPNGTTVSKAYSSPNSPIDLLNTEPKYIKVLLETTDIPTAGVYSFVAEFKHGSGWLTARRMHFTVLP